MNPTYPLASPRAGSGGNFFSARRDLVIAAFVSLAIYGAVIWASSFMLHRVVPPRPGKTRPAVTDISSFVADEPVAVSDESARDQSPGPDRAPSPAKRLRLPRRFRSRTPFSHSEPPTSTRIAVGGSAGLYSSARNSRESESLPAAPSKSAISTGRRCLCFERARRIHLRCAIWSYRARSWWILSRG